MDSIGSQATASRVRWYPSTGFDLFADRIERYVGQEFPTLIGGRVEDVMTAVVQEFFATKQYRIGPKPLPESEVMIRDVVRRAIQAEKPIPILIALAAIKVPIGESLDVAELAMLKTLCSLQHRVKQYYPPGVNIRLRLEDLTEQVISGPNGDAVEDLSLHVYHYMQSLQQLIKALDYDSYITAVPESKLVEPQLFYMAAENYALEFGRYLDGDTGAVLSSLGWTGGVSPQMREWMYDRYSKLYPGTERGGIEQRRTLSRYLSAILVRRNLDAIGRDKSFDGRLELSFAPALPDAPRVSTRIYYRTVPTSQSSLHMSPWLAKGYMRIDEDGVPVIALGRWEEGYTIGQLQITSKDGFSTTVRADYRMY